MKGRIIMKHIVKHLSALLLAGLLLAWATACSTPSNPLPGDESDASTAIGSATQGVSTESSASVETQSVATEVLTSEETQNAATEAPSPAETQGAAPEDPTPAETQDATPEASTPAETQDATPEDPAPAETQGATPGAPTPAETQDAAPEDPAPAETQDATPETAEPIAPPTEDIDYAPDFEVLDENGNTVKLSDFRGKPVVLNFWATWCPPCKAELPDFNQAAEDYAGEVAFLMVNLTDGYNETIEGVKSFISANGYTFPVYFDTQYSAATAYNVSAIPTTYLINAKGEIAGQKVGMMSAEELERSIKLLTE